MRRCWLAGVMALVLAGCGGAASPAPVSPAATNAAGRSSPAGPSLAEPSPAGETQPPAEQTPEPTAPLRPGPTAVATPAPTPLPSAAATPAGTPGGSAATTVSLPVVGCEVDDATGEPLDPKPGTQDATLPADQAGTTTWYWTGRGAAWLGPAGWTCSGLIAGNGTSSVLLQDPADAKASITYTDAAMSYAYILEIACPLFPAAAEAYKADFSTACAKRPARETSKRVSSSVGRFTDPAGVAGTGDESGHAYAATGAIFYDGNTALKMTCVLSTAGAARCEALVGAFIGIFGE